VRIPFFIEARTPSWSMLTGKVNLRSKSPNVRSEIRYVGGVSMHGCCSVVGAAASVMVGVLEDSAMAIAVISGFRAAAAAVVVVVVVRLSVAVESSTSASSSTVDLLKLVVVWIGWIGIRVVWPLMLSVMLSMNSISISL